MSNIHYLIKENHFFKKFIFADITNNITIMGSKASICSSNCRVPKSITEDNLAIEDVDTPTDRPSTKGK
jgi:hypothetical protein